MTLISCNEENSANADNGTEKGDRTELNSYPPYFAEFDLSFADAAGPDKAQNIPTVVDPQTADTLLLPGSYTLTAQISDAPPRHTVRPIEVKQKGTKRLRFSVALLEAVPPYTLKRIDYEWRCAALFGNDNTHRIAAQWKEAPNREFVCTHIEFDGKILPVSVETKNGTSSYSATVALH